MGRKSSIHKLRPEVRARIEKHLRDDRLTLDEIIADLREQYPDDANLPSRSSVWRQKTKFAEMMRRAREQHEMAAVLVSELGENPDEKAGALMVQSITTLATHASMMAQGSEDVDVDDVRKLARAAKDVMDARRVSRQERIAIREDARRELLEEQKAALAALPNKGGVSDEAKAAIRQALGIT